MLTSHDGYHSQSLSFSPRDRSTASNFNVPSRDGVAHGSLRTLAGFSNWQKLRLQLKKKNYYHFVEKKFYRGREQT